ncbi:hypothetical protein DYB36_006843 [Aphanomyces astaci]|uniref:WH2 domain-containing protein n=1 Tax=Aphanomyces astaci TaxID=112090 RepID=A0A396ZXY9_APHAT|nr:hypothetical protein DYB36_006843 [Aphanomyces astaci]
MNCQMSQLTKKPDEAVVEALVGFVEVATHEFLYVGLYDKWKKFDVPVHICRHPRLLEYIRSVVASCRPWIVQGRVESLSVAVRSTKTGALLTTCVFELRLLACSITNEVKEQVDEVFRRALVQLSVALLTNPLPNDHDERTFRMFLRTIEDTSIPETLVGEQDIQQSWILATPADANDDASAALLPIASTSQPALPLQLNLTGRNMDKKRQPVHEGYLQWLAASAGGLQTQYCQLSWSCQLRMYPTETAAASGVGGRPFSIRGFCKWEGRGVLPLDSYGIELQVKDKGQSSIYLAAENRLDLERWCRAFVAVLDPSSDAADEIKRERRKVKRDIRKQAEKEAEIKAQEDEFKRRWIAQKKQELRDRELEIEQMTPLQRKDGLGTLDEETEALLRDRKKRLNKKAGQQVGRVGKQVLRRRMELLGGGKVVVHPNDATFGDIAASAVVGQRKAKVKVELPPPVPAELAVVYLSAAVELRQAKSVAIYRFAFRLRAHTSMQCEFGRSYHEYEAIHGQLKRSVVMEVPWPNFPSRHVLRNPTKPYNMQKRAGEFLAYFEALVQIKAVVAHPAFHAAFQVPAAMATSLVRGTVVVEPPPPGIQIKQVAATTRKSQHKPRHLAKPGVPKRNLFEEDEDEEDEEASVASSVETPEPVKRPVADRVGSGSRRSVDERPHRGMEDRPPSSARKVVALGTTDRPPSTKEIQAAGMPRPNLFGGAGRGDLLAAIRKGAQLNKVASPEDNDTRSNVSTTTATTNAPIRAPPPANSLLAALQQAPPLKKAGPPPATKVVAAPTPPLAAPSIHDSIAIAMAAAARPPKAVRRAAPDSRRVTTEKAEQDALQTTAETPAPAAYQPPPFEHQQEPTFGQVMKSNFLWGAGMSLGFILIGGIFRVFMEPSVASTTGPCDWEGGAFSVHAPEANGEIDAQHAS